MILHTLHIDADEFAAGTGWDIKPQGACKGEVCVPLPDGYSLVGAAERLGMALAHEPTHDVWALGPESIGSRALVTAEAPDLVLPDLSGRPFQLSSLRGKKVVLVAWAPY